MKKMIFAAALLAGAAFGVNAQENVNLPESGDFAVEVQFNPFTDSFETFGLDGMKLQGRYFFSNADALRIGLGFGVTTDKNTLAPDAEGVYADEWTKNRVGNFAISLGYERHFLQSGRVDLYAGAGLGFSLKSTCDSKNKVYQQWSNTENKNIDVLHESKVYNASSFNQFDVNVFTGIDFYVYRGLYVGAELGLKVGFKNFPGQYTKGGYVVDGKYSSTPDENDVWDDSIESTKGSKSTSFELATYVEPALRLGWTF